MKKLLVVLFVCFLLVGCTNPFAKKEENVTPSNTTQTQTEPEKKDTRSVMSCSTETEASGITFLTEMTFYFENEKAVKLGLKYVYYLSGYTAEQRNAFASANMCETDAIKNTVGMSECKEELVGTDYVVTGFADNLLKKVIGGPSLIKTAYEQQGWTCK